ncbi:60S acidic ribosomal protein family [Pimephales promelas]|nr:60S acidic ribosomal protein family [Pimephales promelas]
MAESDGAVEEQEMETQEINSDEEALNHFSKYSEARAAVPWEQRTFKEKLLHHADRIFLIFLALFLLVHFGDFMYKMWYGAPCSQSDHRILLHPSAIFLHSSSLFRKLQRDRRFVSFADLKMRYVAAYLLAVLGGNTNPSAKDIKNILGSVGIEADDERLNKVISELNGKDINEVMNAGLSKLASVPAGGAVAVSAAATGGAGAAPAAGEAPAAEEKKEEKKEESEESDEDMGFGLFD